MTTYSKTILITGCSSGIGLEAAKMLRKQGGKKYRLLLVARSMEKAEAAKEEVMMRGDRAINEDTYSVILPFECDMSSFASIRAFSKEIHSAIGSNCSDTEQQGGIDVMCLNAGMCLARGTTAPPYSSDGIEMTLVTNHFGPFLLTNLLLDLMNKGGRVVITASGVHNKSTFGNFEGVAADSFDEKGKAPYITTADEKLLCNLDGSEWDYYQAYAQSKLCNVAFCTELNRRLVSENRGIVANCFCPGLITSTGLFAQQPYVLRTLFGLAANHVFGFGDTVEWGAGALVWMATSEEARAAGGLYWKNPTSGASRKGAPKYGIDFKPVTVSEEAANEKNGARLWRLSAAVTGAADGGAINVARSYNNAL